MPYTEIKTRNEKKYYYRTISIRSGNKIKKERIYLGKNLSQQDLIRKKLETDKHFREAKINKNIEFVKNKIIDILKKYNVKKAGVFGSYARGEQKKGSDVDILIEPPEGMGLNFVSLGFDLEKALKKKVDLITYKYINPHLKKYIMADEVRMI